MKIEIEISDLEEIFETEYSYESVNGVDIKKGITDLAIKKFVDDLYDNVCCYDAYDVIKNACGTIVEDNKIYIIETVIEKVTETILKKKAIVDSMPKKSEISGINKEWEEYFMELIDKAIAKRFK